MSIFKFKTQNKKFKTAERTNTENNKNKNKTNVFKAHKKDSCNG